MRSWRINLKIGCGVLLTIAAVLLFPPLAIAMAIAQGLSKDGADWIFVLFFLRREVVSVASEMHEKSQRLATEEKEKEERENPPANTMELQSEKLELPTRINENIRVVGLDNYFPVPDWSRPTTPLRKQYENMQIALNDAAPFHFHGETESKRCVKNFYEIPIYAKYTRHFDVNPADVAKKVSDNFFKGVTEQNLTERNFPRMLLNATPELKELAIMCDIPRDSFLLNNGGTIFNLVTPTARQADQDVPQKDQIFRNERVRFFLQNLCCAIYRKFPTDGERVRCLRTFLSMPYTQGTYMLAIIGRLEKQAEINKLSHGEKTPDRQKLEFCMLSCAFAPIMARALVFHLNNNASITVDANAFCAPDAALFTEQAQICIQCLMPKDYTYTPSGPPFAYSHVKLTHSYGENTVIDAAECAYRY
jgi:hypothetical protein